MIPVSFLQFISLIFVCYGSPIEADNESRGCGCGAELNGITSGVQVILEIELNDVKTEIQLLREKITELNGLKSEIQLLSEKITSSNCFNSEVQPTRAAIQTRPPPVYRGGVLYDYYSEIYPEQDEIEEQVEEDEKGLCKPGFTYIRDAGSCYKMVYEKFNWTLAGERCNELHPDAHLVAITTQQENDAVKTFLRRHFRANRNNDTCHHHHWGDRGENLLWTGLHQVNLTCQSPFVWVMHNQDQLPLNITDWSSSEPNCDLNIEHCAHLIPMNNFHWNDIPCDTRLCALCEYEIL